MKPTFNRVDRDFALFDGGKHLTMGRGRYVMKFARGLALSVLLGIVGGMICGSAILSLCALSGRIQTTGEDYLGFWNYGLLLVGSIYGGPLGAMMGPLAYITLVRNMGFKRAIVPAALGTILAG
jgi:hypothetical protein